jgi:hypothetical protein
VRILSDFEKAHKRFIEYHLSKRTGERKGRLLRGHQHAEKLLLQNVWWPIYGNLDHLHPEYEVYDWNRKSQFFDYAFIPTLGQFGLECDGFQSHVKDMDREKHNYSVNRESFLTGMGWKMVHFSYDDVQNRPEICQTLLQLVINPYIIQSHSIRPADVIEKDVLRFAWSLGRLLRPIDVTSHYNVDFRTARKWLRSMVDKGWLIPIIKNGEVRYYELRHGTLKFLL